MIDSVFRVQQCLSGFFTANVSDASLTRSAGALLRVLPRLEAPLTRVRDNYLPNIEPSLASLERRFPLAPAVESSLILGLLTFWNALTALHEPSGEPCEPLWNEASVAARLKALGLRGDAAPLASSVFRARPSDPALGVMGGGPVTRKWFRERLQESALWNQGVKGEIAPALADYAVDLERKGDHDFKRAIAVTKGFRDFAERIKASRGVTPLPSSLKSFLVSEDFVRSATHRDARRRRVLIGFLEFADIDPRKIPSGNLARFPSFESFQWDSGDWTPYNNFHLHFFRVSRKDGENVYRTHTPAFLRFQAEHPGLERTLSDYVTAKHGSRGGGFWIKPAERLLYEAYRLMAALPEARKQSLIT